MCMTLLSGLHWDVLHSSVDDGFISGNVVGVVEEPLKWLPPVRLISDRQFDTFSGCFLYGMAVLGDISNRLSVSVGIFHTSCEQLATDREARIALPCLGQGCDNNGDWYK